MCACQMIVSAELTRVSLVHPADYLVGHDETLVHFLERDKYETFQLLLDDKLF